MHVIFLLSDHLLSQNNNQVSESLTLMDGTLVDVTELDVMARSMVQDLGQDLVQEVVASTLVVEGLVLMVLVYRSQSHLARKVLVDQKVRLLFLEASEVSEG